MINTLRILRRLDKKAKLCLYLIIGYLFIGIHQLFEFLSIYTGNSIVYKTGLLFSISSMIFNFRATEIFLGKSIKMNLVYISMFLLVIHMATREMYFENFHFYVRGKSHFYWGALWLFYFLYWNFIHLQAYIKSGSQNKKYSLALPFCALNLSFIASAIYCYTFGFIKNHLDISKCGSLMTNFEIVFDAPSIWCVFASFQGFFIYKFVKNLYKDSVEIPIPDIEISLVDSVIYSAIILLLIYFSLPFVSALSYKMILK